ncbi:MAG: AI-2E family transporter [Gemmatimonadota bacterium]
MPILDTNRDRASWLVAILGVVILFALLPYASGLLGAPVLYVVFAPLFEWLARHLRSRPLAAVIVIIIALIGVVLPVGYMVSLLVGQAQDAVKSILASPLLQRLDTLRIGTFEIGPQIREAGSQVLSTVGGSAISLLGTATRMTLNLLFTFFGLYYLLLEPEHAWAKVRPAIPFSDASATILKERFVAITKSTILGTGAAALIQGVMVGGAFLVSGIANPMFWGSVTVLLSVMPVVGSGMVWGPAAIYLFSQGQTGWAIAMVVWGLVAVGNVDNLIRPWVSNRYAQIHPLITLVGAVAGVSYLGIIGLLIGPLALSYFFELLSMYRREYLHPQSTVEPVPAAEV